MACQKRDYVSACRVRCVEHRIQSVLVLFLFSCTALSNLGKRNSSSNMDCPYEWLFKQEKIYTKYEPKYMQERTHHPPHDVTVTASLRTSGLVPLAAMPVLFPGE